MSERSGSCAEQNHTSRRTASVGSCLAAAALALASLYGWAAPASADDLPTVTIGKAVDTLPYTVEDVGIAEGFFKKNGVNVKEILLQGSSAASAAMVGGSLQFSFEAAVPLMLARSHGVPVISVAAVDDSVTLQFLASKQWLAKHPVPANATLQQKMADLDGSILAQVGATDPAFYALVRSWAGLPKDQGYRIESMDSQAAASVALQRGIVDVMVASPPHSVELTQAGDAVNFVDRKDVPQFNDLAYDLLTTTDDYAKKNPQIVKAVATAVAESLNFMREHPDQTLSILQAHYPKLSKSALLESLQFIPLAKDGLQSQKAWDRALSLAQETGFVKGVKAVPEGVYWTNQYVDAAKLGK
jgi:ABC-type nitrate/sulfonate/bicarbonate transport system substrate-binding protein